MFCQLTWIVFKDFNYLNSLPKSQYIGNIFLILVNKIQEPSKSEFLKVIQAPENWTFIKSEPQNSTSR
jgi:hypothetical protein